MSRFSAVPRWFIVLVLVGAVVAVYGNTFRNHWTYDDRYVVVENPDNHSLREFLENHYPGRPLRELSYMVDYKLFGTEPAGYHIQQLLWHSLNGILLLVLFTRLGVAPWSAALGVLLFLVHPVQAESVANVAHRKELLALFFSLAAFLSYLAGMSAASLRRIFFFLCAAGLFCLALLGNATAAPLPILAIAYEALFVPADRRVLLRRPLLLLLAALTAGGIVIYQYRELFSIGRLLDPYTKNGFTASLDRFPFYMGALAAIPRYVGKLIWPLRLAPEYVVHFSTAKLQPMALLGGALLLLALVLIVRTRRTSPVLAFAISWSLLMYLPVANIVPAGYMMADRYLYLCLPGMGLALAWLAERYAGKATVLACICVLSFLSTLTVIQNSYWRNETTLWRHAEKVNPDSGWVQGAVADSYLLEGNFVTAREHLEKALALNRSNLKAYLTLGRVDETLGDYRGAVRNYEIFQIYGEDEYPAATADVRARLPQLRVLADRQGKKQ